MNTRKSFKKFLSLAYFSNDMKKYAYIYIIKMIKIYKLEDKFKTFIEYFEKFYFNLENNQLFMIFIFGQFTGESY
jgi:hypothetical protein